MREVESTADRNAEDKDKVRVRVEGSRCTFVLGAGLLSILVLIVLRIVVVLLLAVTCLTIPCPATLRRGIPWLRRGISLVVGRREVALPHLRSPPWWDVGSTCCDVVTCTPSTPRTATCISRSLRSLSQLRHEVSELGVKSALHQGVRRWLWSTVTTTTVGCSVRVLVDGTVTSHVPSTTTHTTNDVSGEVTLFGAVVFAMADTTAVLADLVLVITQSTVEGGEFTKLVPLVVVLSLGGRSSLPRP